MTIGNIVENITNTLNSVSTPAMVLPPFLLKCTALTRPGLSPYKIASEIIQNNEIEKGSISSADSTLVQTLNCIFETTKYNNLKKLCQTDLA